MKENERKLPQKPTKLRLKNMKTLRHALIILTILGTFLSCKNRLGVARPKLEPQEQKSPIFVLIEIDGKSYIDIQESYCLSRSYDISRDRVGPVSDPVFLGILECEKIVGRSPEEYGVFATWLDDMRHWLLGFSRKKR